jgi:diadenosine tetraphosphatase ApaH/serine/threonine PP2A family protein phosphatase
MGFIDLRAFNDQAARAVTIQAELLSEESREFLELLDIVDEEGEISFAHGSPRDPIWEYVVSSRVAQENFSAFKTQICLVGHSHIPSIFVENDHGRPTILTPQHADRWRSDQRFILNPGSVGQPRDRNPKAAYVIWDDQENTWLFKRVAYDVESVQKLILALGIPSRHASRLSQGI